jgi:hypothetical protein
MPIGQARPELSDVAYRVWTGKSTTGQPRDLRLVALLHRTPRYGASPELASRSGANAGRKNALEKSDFTAEGSPPPGKVSTSIPVSKSEPGCANPQGLDQRCPNDLGEFSGSHCEVNGCGVVVRI